MALVESSHYTDDDGLSGQVGQYSPPPPVRLRRGGLGRLAIAMVAALGSGVTLYFAVTTTPANMGDGDVASLSAAASFGELDMAVGKDTPAGGESAESDDHNAGRQLAVLAGAEFLPNARTDPGLNNGSPAQIVDLNTSAEIRGLLIPSDEMTTVAATQSAPAAHNEVNPDVLPVQNTDQLALVVEVRVPFPKTKPGEAVPEATGAMQFASAELVEDHPQARNDSIVQKEGASSQVEPSHPGGSRAKPSPGPGLLQASAATAATGSGDSADQGADGSRGQSSAEVTPSWPAGSTLLNPAPWVKITERSTNGLLPIAGPNGETSREHYARPFPADEKRPRIAIVVGGLGQSQKATTAAIDRLPPEVTLAFAPYGKNLQTSINRARSRGHEVLLELPMEPFDYPANDPGPFTLLTTNDLEQNTQRLEWLLAQFNGYVGVTNYLGAKFTATPEALLPILRQLDGRGLLVLDDGTSNRSQVVSLSRKLNVPYGLASRTVDLRVSRVAIDDALLDLENVTRRKGTSIGMAYAYPVSIDRIALWASTLEQKGFVLAPVSANVQGLKSDLDVQQHAPTY